MLQHVRRFAKQEYLPEHLRLDVETTSLTTTEPSTPATLHFLVGPTSVLPIGELERIFSSESNLFNPLLPTIRVIPVPLYAPTSATQAADWGTRYWPIIYKNTNPYGPHPALVARAQLELLANGGADLYLSLAQDVGSEAAKMGHGEAIGAVVVERRGGMAGSISIVAVAGDARFRAIIPATGRQECSKDGNGNVMGHAAMRVIGMVAEKRRILGQPTASSTYETSSMLQPVVEPKLDPFLSFPIAPLENQYLSKPSTLSTNGYLCLDLEIYLTHEPCIMCAMAILHSRFGRVVFSQAMPKTGALSAEPGGLEYGLFWRDQLNWKLLCWQWNADDNVTTARDNCSKRLDDNINA